MRRFALHAAAAALLLAIPAFAEWPEARDAFRRAFEDPVAENREIAVRELKDFDHPEGMKLLLECYGKENDPVVRHALADQINASTNVHARDVFRETILKHPDENTRARYCAVFADERMLDRIEMLRFLMRDPSPVVRARCCRNVGAKDSFLIRDASLLLADPIADVRMAACTALGSIGSKEAAPRLVEALEKEQNRELRWGLSQTLAKLSGEDHGEDVAAWKVWLDKYRLDGLAPVDRALAKAATWIKPELEKSLLMDAPPGAERRKAPSSVMGLPLMIYAAWHAGVPEHDPVMVAGIEYLLEFRLTGTYDVGCAAMCLADISSTRFAERLTEMGQWFVDTQAINGQWSYGFDTRPNTNTKSDKKKDTPTPSGVGTKPGDTQVLVKKTPLHRPGSQRVASGDNSNTQYGLLGLRACATACEPPRLTWQRSLEWFVNCQCKDGGWSYMAKDQGGYQAMTVTGLASLVICMRALGRDDELQVAKLNSIPTFKAGLSWMSDKWEMNNGTSFGGGAYYTIYGIERAGMILGLDKFGAHDWYEEGKVWLLEKQAEDGSWGPQNGAMVGMARSNWDSCFAILFLKKATKGYTATGPSAGNDEPKKK